MRRALRLMFVLGMHGLLLGEAASQPAKVPHIGFLASGSAANSRSEQVAKRLNELGYRDGENARFQFRDASGQPDRLREMADELVRGKPDVIVAVTNASAFAVKRATTSIPVVVYAAHDAVGTGLVASLARPGGNITGVDSLAPVLDAKRLEILKQLVPALAGVNVLFNPDDPGSGIHMRLIEEAARTMNVAMLKQVEVRTPAEFEKALSAIAPHPREGLLTLTDPVTANWKPAARFALSRGVPTACEYRFLAELGCLFSYGPMHSEIREIVARQVTQILGGLRPGDIPFVQPSKFELVINQGTAKLLGLAIPKALAVAADEVLN